MKERQEERQEGSPQAKQEDQSSPFTTTQEHFTIFKEEAQYWIDKFGLKGYKVFFLHGDRDKDEDGSPRSFANYNASVVGRNAVLCLTKTWNDQGLQDGITEHQIRSSAFHEVWELLLHRLFHMAENRAYTEYDFQEEKHNIIRIMENVVWREDWEGRRKEEEANAKGDVFTFRRYHNFDLPDPVKPQMFIYNGDGTKEAVTPLPEAKLNPAVAAFETRNNPTFKGRAPFREWLFDAIIRIGTCMNNLNYSNQGRWLEIKDLSDKDLRCLAKNQDEDFYIDGFKIRLNAYLTDGIFGIEMLVGFTGEIVGHVMVRPNGELSWYDEPSLRIRPSMLFVESNSNPSTYATSSSVAQILQGRPGTPDDGDNPTIQPRKGEEGDEG